MCGVSSDGYLPPSGTIDLPLAHAIPELVPAYYCHKLAASKIPNENSIMLKNDSFYYARKENVYNIDNAIVFRYKHEANFEFASNYIYQVKLHI